MANFIIRVAYEAPTVKDAEKVFANLQASGVASAFSVPMAGSTYTIWMTLPGGDPKEVFASAVDSLRNAASYDIQLVRLEMQAEDAPRPSAAAV